mmetsp:Transcript_10107/g.13167  ORF Transcript_10107/g.13167 Transcript_10107/m.13167 type:complete len:693 (-) Transcript_10107:695-2773(-)|eukprot:CAMPEP_0117747456 /NCGR_PEP_ID=MMETSP0947-20121206/8517_1 /TAXON_ID=44440 /ORGANISM="Chattonella subsalsa, Strain CCMP2191" /LENGTH=692 /DNA_ID=CAMNT_0005564903 /DNA_START=37 /DNA_END=2118 /DNA_ORIENTATION=+
MMSEMDGTYYWHPHRQTSDYNYKYNPFEDDMMESNRLPTAIIKSNAFQKKQKCFFKLSTILMSIFIVSAILAPIKSRVSEIAVVKLQTKNQNSLQSSSTDQGNFDDLSFIAKNPDYDQTYHEGYSWGQIVEPHRKTLFEAKFGFTDLEVENVTWIIDGEVQLEGNPVEFTFTKLGQHSVTLIVSSVDGQVLGLLESSVMCKYVRREIRSLTEEDRNEFLDTLFAVYTVPTESGNGLWGPKYKHISYFVDKHLTASAAKECDHWHDNMGLLNTHSAFTLEMEQALQAVNPRVAMAYWDYTIDYAIYGPNYKRWATESPLFTKEYFGPADGGGGDNGHVISAGRWAFYKIAHDAEGLHRNAFGYLRSPWNQNPSPYLERSETLYGETYGNTPTCQQFQDLVMADSLGLMMFYATGTTHGLLHLLVGGGWAHPNENLLQDQNLAGDNLGYAKHLWRTGFSRCPEECSLDAVEDCSCTVPDEYIERFGAYNILTEKTNILHWMNSKSPGIVYNAEDKLFHVLGDGSQDEEDEFWKLLLQSLADVGSVGEMFTSASPYDPLFWPLHPTIERATFWRRLNLDQAPMDETWKYPSEKSSPTNTGFVCDWTHVSGPELPTCIKHTACYGHGQDDMIDFTDFVHFTKEKYTNLEYYRFASPENPTLPYVYDNFDFDHCERNGVSFDFDTYYSYSNTEDDGK